MVYDSFVFFDETSTQSESSVYRVTHGDQMLISVSPDGESRVDEPTIDVMGRVDKNKDIWYKLGVVDNTSFEALEEIKNFGIFSVSIAGISEIRLEISDGNVGSYKVFGVVC